MTNPTQTTEAPERIELSGGYYLLVQYLGKGNPFYRLYDGNNEMVHPPYTPKIAQAFAAAMQSNAGDGALREALSWVEGLEPVQNGMGKMYTIPSEPISTIKLALKKALAQQSPAPAGEVAASHYNTLCNACQIMDALKNTAPEQWSDFDQQTRDSLTVMLQALTRATADTDPLGIHGLAVNPTVKENLTVEPVTPAAEAVERPKEVKRITEQMAEFGTIFVEHPAHEDWADTLLDYINDLESAARRDAAPADVEGLARELLKPLYHPCHYYTDEEQGVSQASERIMAFLAKREGK